MTVKVNKVEGPLGFTVLAYTIKREKESQRAITGGKALPCILPTLIRIPSTTSGPHKDHQG